MDAYRQASQYIDWHHPSVNEQAKRLAKGKSNTYDIAKSCFEFVRDEIKHSSDYALQKVTISASDALHHGSGFCYAKSHLLAALLRANEIPAAICYQRVSMGGDSKDFCLHALNAVYLPEEGWYRIDARGNTPLIDAQFSPPVEKLAFELFGLGEFFVDGLFAKPLKVVCDLLASCDTVTQVNERITETDQWNNAANE